MSTAVSIRAGSLGPVKSFARGTELCAQGAPVDDVYLIRSGVVKLTWTDETGGETIVGLRWRGWFAGASAAMAGVPSCVTAVARTDSTVEHLKVGRFLHLMKTNPEFAEQLHRSHCLEVLEQARDLGELALVPAQTRLHNLLSRLATSNRLEKIGDRMRLPITKGELALCLSITPEHLSRLLDQMNGPSEYILSGQWLIQPPSITAGITKPAPGSKTT